MITVTRGLPHSYHPTPLKAVLVSRQQVPLLHIGGVHTVTVDIAIGDDDPNRIHQTHLPVHRLTLPGSHIAIGLSLRPDGAGVVVVELGPITDIIDVVAIQVARDQGLAVGFHQTQVHVPLTSHLVHRLLGRPRIHEDDHQLRTARPHLSYRCAVNQLPVPALMVRMRVDALILLNTDLLVLFLSLAHAIKPQSLCAQAPIL